MRNLRLLLIVPILSTILISCTDNPPKPPDNSEISSKDSFAIFQQFIENSNYLKYAEGEYYLNTEVAKEMLDSFKYVYCRDKNDNNKVIEGHKDNFWIDKKTFKALKTYLDKNGNDGIRIYSGCDLSSNVVTSPIYKKTTTINILSTIPKSPTVSNCKGRSYHCDVESGININGVYFKSKQAFQNSLNEFKYMYQRNLTDTNSQKQLTEAVWINKEVIDYLVLYLDNPIFQHLTGVDIRFASYKGNETKLPDYAFKKQSTVVLVVTKKDPKTGGNIPDWNVIQAKYLWLKAKGIFKDAPILGGYNKAELCPQVCN